MLYASGESPVIGDRVTLRGRKPTNDGGVVVEMFDGVVYVRWTLNSRATGYSANQLVLVRPWHQHKTNA